jgi:hypothetical protein
MVSMSHVDPAHADANADPTDMVRTTDAIMMIAQKRLSTSLRPLARRLRE